MRLIGQFLVALVLMTGLLIMGILPVRLSNLIGEMLGRLAYYVVPRWRNVALNNLRHVYRVDGAEGPARAVFTHLGRSLAEVSRLMVGRTGIYRTLRAEGYEHLERALADGKGVIFVSGHCGNWELVPQFVGLHSQVKVVGRRVDNPFVDRLLIWFRGRTGNKSIPKEGALRTLIRELRAGKVVAMLVDQGVVEAEGVRIDFLDHPAWVMKIPALVAAKTGAAVLPIFIHRRDDGGHTISVEPPVELVFTGETDEDLRENTARISARIERYIRQYPDQWLWIHRRWKRAAEEVWGRP